MDKTNQMRLALVFGAFLISLILVSVIVNAGSLVWVKKIKTDANCTDCYVLTGESGGTSLSFMDNFYWKSDWALVTEDGRLVTWGEYCSGENIECKHYWFRGLK